MTNHLIFFLFLALLAKTDPHATETCHRPNCEPFQQNKEQNITPIQQAEKQIDIEVRRNYFYYLRRATKVFTRSSQTKQKYLFLSIYRNMYGTFLVIGEHDKQIAKHDVSIFARVGSGSQKSEPVQQPVKVEPYLLSFKLEEGQYKIQINQQGKFKLENEVMEKIVQEEDSQEIQRKQSMIDNHLRRQYWYFLFRAKLLKTSNILTNEKVHMLLTYVGPMGVYLGLCTCNNRFFVSVSTFIRFGQTVEKKELSPIAMIKPFVYVIS